MDKIDLELMLEIEPIPPIWAFIVWTIILVGGGILICFL